MTKFNYGWNFRYNGWIAALCTIAGLISFLILKQHDWSTLLLQVATLNAIPFFAFPEE